MIRVALADCLSSKPNRFRTDLLDICLPVAMHRQACCRHARIRSSRVISSSGLWASSVERVEATGSSKTGGVKRGP